MEEQQAFPAAFAAVMVIFLILLLDGLAYAWKKGVLRWV